MVSTSGWVVDNQKESLLFKVAPELRNLIFKYILEVYDPRPVPHDFRIKHHHDGDPDDDGVDIEAELAKWQRANRDENSEERKELLASGYAELGDYYPRLYMAGVTKRLPNKHEHISRYGVDPDKPWHEPWYNNKWIRPGCTGAMKVDTAVLRTCRRIYLEAVGHLPEKYKRYVVWPHGNYHLSPPFPNVLDSMAFSLEEGLTSLHIHTETPSCQFDMVKGFAGSRLQALEHLRISFHITGEECFQQGIQPFMDPFESDVYPIMRGNMNISRDFGKLPAAARTNEKDPDWLPPCDYRPDGWGISFWWCPGIKTLVLDFDIEAALREKMEPIIEWAGRVWHFPLAERPDGCAYLSARGNPVRKMSWRGVKGHWRYKCATCYTVDDIAHSEWELRECDACDRKEVLRARNLGPRMYTWTMTWTPRVGETWAKSPAYLVSI